MEIKDKAALVMTAMYMALAVDKKCWRVNDPAYEKLSDNSGGHIGIMQELANYAELSQAILEHLAVDNWPGVYEYEVSEPFGTWWINEAMEHGTSPDTAEATKALLEYIHEFFDGQYSMETLQQACEAVRNGQS